MPFVAIDFETANACLSSVCQIGVATFDDNSHTDTWHTLVNPQDCFDGMNVYIHRIDEDAVKDAPTFSEAYEKLSGLLAGQIVAHHTGFDKIAFGRAAEKYRLPRVECNWRGRTRAPSQSGVILLDAWSSSADKKHVRRPQDSVGR